MEIVHDDSRETDRRIQEVVTIYKRQYGKSPSHADASALRFVSDSCSAGRFVPRRLSGERRR